MSAPAGTWAHEVAERAGVHGRADAVVTDRRRVSYEELASQAGGIQRWLGSLEGAAAGPVAILVSDPIDRAAAVLGVAAAGRPHVLLDPQRSPEALRASVDRIGVDVAIGDGELEQFGAHLHPDDVRPRPLEPVPVTIDDPFAYVSTSGSTGDPKYVLLTHAVLCARTHPDDLAIGEGDRAFRAFNHSGNSLNILIDALRVGATYLSVDPLRVSASGLLEFLVAERASVVRMSPSLMRLVLRPRARGDLTLATARVVGGGGEPMLWSDVAALRGLAPSATVTHGYASTETRGVTQKVIGPADPILDGAVPAGRPRQGRRVWIDAGDGRRAGPGTVGTIVVEGRFGTIGPSFEQLEGGDLRFRTGDLGELTADGELIHRGRTDRVMKVGAVRIDLRTVEDVLRRAPGVIDVRVMAAAVDGAPPGTDDRLVAHVVVEPDDGPDVTVLRDLARAHLTSAAVPARFVLRDQPLPLLPSGKTDERSLKEQTA